MTITTACRRLADVPDRVIQNFRANANRATRDANSCLIWPLGLDGDGYGLVRYRTPAGIAGIRAHRLAMLIEHGEIADMLVVDHLCRTHACIDTSHLRITTIGENVRAGLSGYANPIKPRCAQGHAYEGDNVRIYVRPDGGETRVCKACDRDKSARYKAKNRPRRH
jgi:hypothetical protein